MDKYLSSAATDLHFLWSAVLLMKRCFLVFACVRPKPTVWVQPRDKHLDLAEFMVMGANARTASLRLAPQRRCKSQLICRCLRRLGLSDALIIDHTERVECRSNEIFGASLRQTDTSIQKCMNNKQASKCYLCLRKNLFCLYATHWDLGYGIGVIIYIITQQIVHFKHWLSTLRRYSTSILKVRTH